MGRFGTEDPAHDGLNWYTYCGGNPVVFVDPLGFEKVVVSGGSDGEENFRYNFIETAIKQIKDWKKSTDETIAWIIANWNYSESDIANFEKVAAENGVYCLIISDKSELFDYIEKENRANDLITEMSFFAHGTAFDMGGVDNGDYNGKYAIALGYSAVDCVSHNNSLNIFTEDLSLINSDSFMAGCKTFFGSCRTGKKFNDVSFAQEWANITQGEVKAAKGINGRTTYINIYPDDRNIFDKVLTKINFKQVKAAREIARAEYGFSSNGCLNYPEPDIFSHWKIFTPNIK